MPTTTEVTVRQLPVEEWERIKDLPFAEAGLPDPSMAAVLVAEVGGEIVGVWAALTAVHLDGLWIHPDHRGTTIAGRLLKGMKALLQSLGIRVSFTVVSDPTVMVLAYKAGFLRCPGDLLVLQLPKED